MSVATINTAADAAVTYIRAGNYASAAVELEAALVLIATMPDTRHGETELRWKPEQLRLMLQDIKQKISAAVGLTSTTVTYTRPDIDTDYA